METALAYRTNRDLFSNYYLDEHLPETEAWNELSVDELRAAKDDILELWEREQGIETVNEEQDINWARRQVVQQCIYGVDVNPLAVELAKVSLWLRTLAAQFTWPTPTSRISRCTEVSLTTILCTTPC